MECLYCGQEIQGKRKSRKFCNDAHKQAYWRRQHQQDQQTALLTELEQLRVQVHDQTQEIARLTALLNVEKRYHQDTQARGLKAWLRKQPPSPLGTRLLADDLLPVRGSRGLYEAYLRNQHCTADEMQEFAHLWKALLLSQS